MMIRGSVDIINKKRVTGWVYSDASSEPVSVEAVIDHQVVGTAVADLLRPDLAAAGFGKGNCGFDIQLAHEIDPLYLPFVQVMLAGTDLEVRRWAGAGFRDYFRALHQRYPRAGRSASVLGGLWTDRTDASALLKGRADIGLLPTDDANCIARFINDGAVTVARNIAPTSSKPKANDMPMAVADVLFDDGVLRALRGILDDNPVAVRADIVDSDDDAFVQMSALEDLPSPAECLGIILPAGGKATAIEVLRGGHRFPEFLPDGLSRWTHAAAARASSVTLSLDLPVDRHTLPRGTAIIIGPGSLYRIRASEGIAIRVLVLPSRLSVLRFHQKPPTGELTHNSGARIWL